MKSVFISYSRQNEYIADRLRRDLERAGCEPWLDERSIPVFSAWKAEIEKAILDHDYFLCLSSPEADTSSYVQMELQIAAEAGDRKIYLARVAGKDSQLEGKLKELQFKDMRVSSQHLDNRIGYWGALTEFLDWMGLTQVHVESAHDLLETGRDAGTVAKMLGESTSWRIATYADGQRQTETYVKIPWKPSGYANCSLVMEQYRQFKFDDELNVVLKFSGTESRSTIQEVLEYLINRPEEPIRSPQVVLFEGPLHRGESRVDDQRGYEISNEHRHRWADCIELICTTLEKIAPGKTVNFFFDSPQALVLSVGLKLKGMFACNIYNLNRNEKMHQRYSLVYSYSGS